MPRPRWLATTAAPVLIGVSLCLSPAAAPQAQGALEEVPFDRKLVAAGMGGAPERFGSVLAVSGDVLVVAAHSATVDGKPFAGAAHLFERDPASGEWTERKRLVAQDGVAFDQLGGSAVAVDGDTVLLGASRAKVGNVLQQGAVYVFERNAGGADNWGQTAKLTDASVGSIGNFGTSIAIQGDLLVVGAGRAGGNGQVTIFERDRGGPGAWGKVAAIPDSAVGDGGSPLEFFGGAVALDGDLLLVGAGSADVSFFGEDDGAAYIFRRDPVDRDIWRFVTRLTAPEATACPGGRTLAAVSLDTLEARLAVQRCAEEPGNRTDDDAFGGRVAIEGDTVVVAAASTEGASGLPVGAVHVFRRDPGGADRWDRIAQLTGSDVLASTSPFFGTALALAGDTLLVGASGVEVGANVDQGAAYRFERGAGGPDAWGEVAKLVAGDGLGRENFGTAAALDGADGIVGASGYELGQGAVYLTGERPVPGPAFAATGLLVDGGVVEGPGGVVLGAVAGAISEPLPVWIVEVPAPDEPLIAGATARGAFYNIGGERRTTATDGAPFGLALPVPEGTDTAHLAAAVLARADEVLDVPEGGELWIPLAGVYDAAGNRFSLALDTLALEGITVVLIEHPDLEPLTRPPVAASRGLGASFEITCHGFGSAELCGDAQEEQYGFELAEAHARFTESGYENPALRNELVLLDTPGSFSTIGSLTYVGNQIRPKDIKACGDINGEFFPRRYVFFGRKIEFCYAPGVTSDIDIEATVPHELFHAFQVGFPGLDSSLSGPEDYAWVIEGTATAAQNSSTQMARDALRLPLAIDRGLTSLNPANDPYKAQDFWVYFGQERGLGLDYLRPLFERGGTTQAAAEFFSEVHQTSLGDEYWAWVKNQAFEKTNDLGHALEDPCRLEFDRDTLLIGTVPVLPHGQGGGESPRAPVVEGILTRLTAQVVRITFARDLLSPTLITAGEQAGLKYKVYLNGIKPCGGEIDDGPRTFPELAITDMIYVLLANTEHEPGSRIQYKLEVKPAPP